ncbi:TPA: hypothetical protein ACTW51_005334, partial [Klebsiella quasipneumoniae subsp. quasipneumoniae]
DITQTISRERHLPGHNTGVVALLSVARAGKFTIVPLFRRVAAAPYPACRPKGSPDKARQAPYPGVQRR